MSRPDGALARRQRRRQLVEAVDAGDLLDQVRLALDVGVAPGRHAPPVSRVLEAEPLEDLGHALRRDALAEQPLHALLAQPDHARLRRVRVDVDRAGHEARAAQLDHQPSGEPLRRDRLLGVKLLLEARRRLACAARAPSRSA